MTRHILIATPLYPPDVGGPSYYVQKLTDELRELGQAVEIVNFRAYRHLPSGIRHIAYLLALLRKGRGSSFILGFDVFSVGLPVVIAGKLLGIPTALRVSGDFLWERASEKKDAFPFKTFYAKRDRWGSTEKNLFTIIGWTLRHASGLIFQNAWQRNYVTTTYRLGPIPSTIIRNDFPGVTPTSDNTRKNFLWAGRDMKLKNLARLKEAFAKAKEKDPSIELDILTGIPQSELFERIKTCYAVVCPSLSEMNPNIILEGVRFGKPFICTKETGIGEVLEGAGIFVDPLDTQAIESALVDLATPETYRKYTEHIATLDITHTYADIAKEILEFVDGVSLEHLPAK